MTGCPQAEGTGGFRLWGNHLGTGWVNRLRVPRICGTGIPASFPGRGDP